MTASCFIEKKRVNKKNFFFVIRAISFSGNTLLRDNIYTNTLRKTEKTLKALIVMPHKVAKKPSSKRTNP